MVDILCVICFVLFISCFVFGEKYKDMLNENAFDGLATAFLIAFILFLFVSFASFVAKYDYNQDELQYYKNIVYNKIISEQDNMFKIHISYDTPWFFFDIFNPEKTVLFNDEQKAEIYLKNLENVSNIKNIETDYRIKNNN